MDKDRQIEEMAKIACVGFREGDCENCKSVGICSSYTISEKLYNAGYRKQEWISVDERLPDPKEYDWVLVNVMFNEDGTYGVPHIAERRNGEWWTGDYNLSDLHLTVTHWTPLPSHPQK